MKKITKENITASAEKIMLQLSNHEVDYLLDELEILIRRMEMIGKLPGIDDVSPMVFPFNISNTSLREDVASEPIDKNELLKNADKVVDGQISLPKVVK